MLTELSTRPLPPTSSGTGAQEKKAIERKPQDSAIFIFPDEVLKKVAECLKDNQDLHCLSRVCDRFRGIAGEVLAARALPEFETFKTILDFFRNQRSLGFF